jgi:mannosylfructose-phosphate synthase
MATDGCAQARSLFTWTGIAQQLIATVEQRPGAALVLADTEWDEPWNDAD